MTIVLTKLNDITHTRIIKFLHDFYINGSYQIKKIGKPSSNEYSVDFIDNINTDSFFKYLKSQGIDYIKENKMKLTNKERKLVKEYANKLIGKRRLSEGVDWDHPILNAASDLFKQLVPRSGPADTVEGEMVRAINRIIYRCYNDGDVIGKGYGKETVTPSAEWLISRPELKGIGSIFRSAATAAIKKKYGSGSRYVYVYDTDAYMEKLLPAVKMVVDYVKSKNGKYTPLEPNTDSRL